MGVALAVNVRAVEGRNMSNVYALNQSQKRCFKFHYVLSVYSYLYCVGQSSFLVQNLKYPKDKISLYDFIMNNKVILYCTYLFWAIFGLVAFAIGCDKTKSNVIRPNPSLTCNLMTCVLKWCKEF